MRRADRGSDGRHVQDGPASRFQLLIELHRRHEDLPGGSAAGGRPFHKIDFEVVVAKHRAAHRRDADGVFADAQLVDHFGDLETAWQAASNDLREAGLDRRSIENLLNARKTLNLDQEIERVEKAGARVIADGAVRLAAAHPPLAALLQLRRRLLDPAQFAAAAISAQQATSASRSRGLK